MHSLLRKSTQNKRDILQTILRISYQLSQLAPMSGRIGTRIGVYWDYILTMGLRCKKTQLLLFAYFFIALKVGKIYLQKLKQVETANSIYEQ